MCEAFSHAACAHRAPPTGRGARHGGSAQCHGYFVVFPSRLALAAGGRERRRRTTDIYDTRPACHTPTCAGPHARGRPPHAHI